MLDGKIAVVTGAGQGLGRGIVCEMARQRAAGIAVVDRNRRTAEETAGLAKQLGANLRATWLATKYAAPHLRRSLRGPSIVNACSVAGLAGFPHARA